MATANSNPFNVRVVIPTPLALAAAVLSPGSWAIFSTNLAGATSLSDLIDSGGGHRITEYSDKMVWALRPTGDPLHWQRALGIGEDHHVHRRRQHVAQPGYTTWFSQGNFFHAYQHNTGRGNTHYVLHFGSTTLHTRDIPSNTWAC